jgi:Domain of unknown function (DUF4189)
VAKIFAFALVLISTVIGTFSPATADGALAVGSTSDINKDGIAFGYVVNSGSESNARSEALESCRNFKRAPRAAAECLLISTFKNECFAIAMDPKDGTPGIGWAIAATKLQAEVRALQSCKATAGSARRQYCEIDTVKCDGESR